MSVVRYQLSVFRMAEGYFLILGLFNEPLDNEQLTIENGRSALVKYDVVTSPIDGQSGRSAAAVSRYQVIWPLFGCTPVIGISWGSGPP